MALDQGTSSSRAIIYNQQGEPLGVASQPIELVLPADGWVEQVPEVLWQSIVGVGRDVIAQLGIDAAQIAAIGITNQRETTLLWDKHTGQCIYNAIVWQDRRTAQRCLEMVEQSQGKTTAIDELIAKTTGLLVDPYFSSTKLEWLLANVEGAQGAAEAGDLCFGTIDSFLIWRLTQGAHHYTDATNASRTQLFDIHEQQWSHHLLDYFSIPAQIMPQVLDSAADFGVASAQWFGAEIPITGVAGDQQAALVGQGCFDQGMSKSTYGTGCFVMTNTGSTAIRSTQKLLTTVAYRVNGEVTYALEGSIFVAGVAIKWLRDQLGLINQASDTEAAYARTQGDAGGVYVVPAFTGLGAPYWQPHSRGLITGLSLDSNRDQVVTAFLQSVVFQTHALLQAMDSDGAAVEYLRVDGGMVVNDSLCQFLADILDVCVERPKNVETTALGAAILAGVGIGLYPGLAEIGNAWQLDRKFEPKIGASSRAKLLQGYQHAVQQALS